ENREIQTERTKEAALMTDAARIWEESTDMAGCAALRVGTSMPIRHVHSYSRTNDKWVKQ
ncbi:hypothetical protein M422DRAFT_37262, partial [Sphaerobolus stellatus SS14]